MQTKTKLKKWERVREIGRIIFPVACLLSVGAGVLSGANVHAEQAGWGPERPTFTWEAPASYRTFNSMTNNATIGDERNFVRIREAGVGNFSDSVNLEVGKEYEVYIYYHNNASVSLNSGGGQGIANNVRLSIAMPAKLSKGDQGVIKGTISSTNTNPLSVWDKTYINAKDTVYLRYVGNSAVIHNDGTANGSVLDAPSLFSDGGAKIGHWKEHWGVVPGCNEYAGYVTYRFKVDKPGFYIEKNASKSGENNYQDTITVKPGEVIDFKINYKNTGTTDQNRVTVYDKTPNGMSYIVGTTFLKTPATTNGVFTEDKLFDGGLVIGDFRAGETGEITYKTEIIDDKNIFPCGDTIIYNNSSVATANGTEYDKVKITVRRECEGVPTTPTQLPKTGPGEVILSLIIVTGIGVGVAYYVVSTRDLSNLDKQAKGKK